MRKSLLILFFIFTSLSLRAQKPFTPETSVGLKGGANTSLYSFTPSLQHDPSIGRLQGLVLKHISERNLGIQLEVNYMQRGWSERVDTVQKYVRQLNYIEVPFMTHVSLGSKKTLFIINFGPSIAYLVSKKDILTPVLEESEGIEYNLKQVDTPLLIGLSVGLGIARKTSIGTFQLEGRGTQSFNNIMSSNQGVSSAKDTNFQLGVTYFPRLKFVIDAIKQF